MDARIDQIAHARRTLPANKTLATIAEQLKVADADLINARTHRDDLQREIDRAEADVQLVRDRAARNRQRLDAGSGSAKDLQAIQHELASLARRQDELEEIQLDVMERAEALDTTVAEMQSRVDALKAKQTDAEKERDSALAELESDERAERNKRQHIAPGVGEELLGLYEKVRHQVGGLAAAELRAGRCGGCQLQLTPVDMQRIRAAADDEVLRCEECRRIMVRTGESGL